MRKIVYVSLFTVLGVIGSFLVHGVVETGVIWLLTNNFAVFGLGLSWEAWFTLHHIASIVLLLAGIALGLWQGLYWHNIIYKKQPKKRKPNTYYNA